MYVSQLIVKVQILSVNVSRVYPGCRQNLDPTSGPPLLDPILDPFWTPIFFL